MTSIDALQELAARAEAGDATHIELIDAFLAATIFVPSTTDPEGGQVDPVISRIDEVDYLVVASTEAALEHTGDVARFAVPMTGRTLVSGMSTELAVLVNLTVGAFALPQAMLDDIRTSANPFA